MGQFEMAGVNALRTVYTVGHSTHSIEEFADLLHARGVEMLVDIRTIPKSRHNPQYWREQMEVSLPAYDIQYAYVPQLGGRRPKSKFQSEEVSGAWRNQSFRNYAEYMQTEGFERGMKDLIFLTGVGTVAICCSEAVPWRCHRGLVADALAVRGFNVVNIMGKTSVSQHKIHDFAVVDGVKVTYPMMGGHMQAQTLEEWLEQHHDPKWKYRKPTVKRLGKARGAGHDREFAALVREYQFQVTETIDYRTIREPVSLERFIELKRDPKWKPKVTPRYKVKLPRLSDARLHQIESEWARAVAQYGRAA